MPTLNGFEVARRVSEELGCDPPRVLLMSGSDPEELDQAASMDGVIGVMLKPLLPSVVAAVLKAVQETRERCPGRVGHFCDQVAPPTQTSGDEPKDACDTPRYVHCPHFRQTGVRFQEWIGGAGVYGDDVEGLSPASSARRKSDS
jgi:DNA-binding response OmpR family regulator